MTNQILSSHNTHVYTVHYTHAHTTHTATHTDRQTDTHTHMYIHTQYRKLTDAGSTPSKKHNFSDVLISL